MERIVLVTGGAGYIGAHMAAELLSAGYRVRVLDNLTYGDKGIKPFIGNKKYEFIKGNICHIEEAVTAMKGVFAVVDLAAIVGDPACEKDREKALTINYEATKVLIEIAKHSRVERFLFASTCSVYGMQKGKVTEKDQVNPISLYAESKLKSEEVILKKSGQVIPTIFRLATVYGGSQRMRFDLVLNIMTIKALAEREIKVYGGQQWRPLVHARDVAKGFGLALGAPDKKVKGQIFNLGSDEQNFRVKDLAVAIHQRFPGTQVEYMAECNDNRSYEVGFTKIKKFLGFRPSLTILDGMSEIEAMYRKKQVKNYKDDIYYNVHYLYK